MKMAHVQEAVDRSHVLLDESNELCYFSKAIHLRENL